MTDPTTPTPTGAVPGVAPLSAEDKKLVTLARATRARIGAREGAAVRDLDGRTYAAATVDLPSLQLSAIAGCVAMAVASGSRGLEAVVLLSDDAVTAETPDETDLAIVRDFAGPGVLVHVGDARGRLAFAQRD
ncbi:cytidine deaminase [Nocardioides insulae]|uniref:cytidine deaminase n=1 Tax=Nocardioides insulae TaxID=394734 RepID=UPI0003F92365|nr:cytidine deaminase [Nocardioides insulae]